MLDKTNKVFIFNNNNNNNQDNIYSVL